MTWANYIIASNQWFKNLCSSAHQKKKKKKPSLKSWPKGGPYPKKWIWMEKIWARAKTK